MLRICKVIGLALLAAAASGCATYTTPGGGVRLDDLPAADFPAATRAAGEEPDFVELVKAEPAASFPARIAIVRIQAPGYSSRTNSCYGEGRYCVVTTRDIESDASYEQLSKLPSMAGLAVMNRFVLPRKFTTSGDLRRAAAALRTDMLLLYTLDTGFKVENSEVSPLTVISLGLLPTRKANIAATASAVMLDVRTGFIYGLAEATAIEEQRANVWSTADAIDSARKKAESVAFEKLVGEIAKFWDDVVRTHRRGNG